MNNYIFKLLFVFFITIIFFYILINKNLVDFNLINVKLTEGKKYLIISSIFYIFALIVNTLRLKYILKKFQIKINFQPVFSMQILSIFFGQFLPLSTLFIETFKIYFLSKYFDINKWKKISYCVLIDKFIGLSSFFLLSFIFSSIYLLQNNKFFIIFIFFTSIFLLIIPKIINFFKIKNFVFNYNLGLEIFISILSSIFFILSYFFIFLIFTDQIYFHTFVIVMPFIILSFLIPLGYAGFGGYQLIAIFVFSFFEANNQIISSASLIFAYITLIINCILGFYITAKNFGLIKKQFKKNFFS